MRILRLNGKNINSLRGDISIDFEEFLKDNSLFAITGPTGSGKSTILDIISCALYGETPRLKNPNNLMSKHTGECFCEVEFEVRGKVYRSSWSLKRAYRKPDGKFQTPKMEIADVETNRILSSKIKEVPKYVEKLSGLDFEKFTKSMMLAQGAFDAFLKAKESDRSSLLEKITGTFIYKEISEKVYEEFKTQEREIDLEKSRLEDIKIFSDNELKEKNTTLNRLSKDKKELEKEREDIEYIYNWLQNLNRVKEEYKKNEREFEKAERELNNREDDVKRVEEAKRALNIEPIYQKRISKEIEVENNRREIEKLEEELKESREILELRSSKYIEIDREYRNINNKLGNLEKFYSKDIEEDILSKEKICREEIKERENLLKNLEEYQKIEDSIEDEKQNKKEFKNRLYKLESNIEYKNSILEELEKHLKTLKEKEKRELLIIKYENDRKRLKDGEECFLCGSKTHPFIKHSLNIDIYKSKKEIRDKESEIKSLNREVKEIEKEISRLEVNLYNSLTTLQKSITQKESIELLFHSNNLKISPALKIELDNERDSFEKELQEIESLKAKREEYFKLQNRIKRELNRIEYKRKKISDEVIYLKSKIDAKDIQFKELQEKNRISILKLQEIEEKFKRELEKQNFTEEQFLNAKLPQKEFEKLERECREIEENFRKIETLKNSTKEKLEIERALNLTDKSINEVKEIKIEIREEIDKTQKEIGSLEQEIIRDRENRENYQEKIKELKRGVEEFKVISKLKDMIGSSKGDKFAKFAQGVTLDQLIYLANSYLNLLNSRYKLQRSSSEKSILEIEIIDRFQADVVRPVTTLSGGESFIVSLSLALGLSSLASQKISIDSLFLDEGFGTLDSENLEMALNALDNLQNRGKIVGVISHVETLKERISSQIKIIPNGDGTSKIVISV